MTINFNEHLLLKKIIKIYDDTLIKITPEWDLFEAIIFNAIERYESVKMGCLRTDTS